MAGLTSPADPTQRRFRGCAKLADYEVTDKLGEGTFGVVSKGRSRRTGAIVALKKILMHNEKDGFPITAMREIKLLKMLSHPNVLKLDEMAVERRPGDGKKRATLYMVTPYMDHDLSGMTTNPDIHFTIPQIKCYLMQLLEGLRYLHDSHILHRDMKAANILISNKGQLQIADFGLARHYEGQSPRVGRGNGEAVRDYTTLVVTRWYRPPELLLSLRRYTPAIDMWGAGCVFAEMFEGKPILEGKTDLNQAEIIFKLVGSPNEANMPGWQQLPGCEGVREWGHQRGDIDTRFGPLLKDKEALDLLKQLLNLDWRTRINAIDALKHPYFTTHPLPARPEDLPRFEESHELDRRKHQEKGKRMALPPAPAGGTVGMGPDEQWTGSGHGGYDDYRSHNDRRYAPAPPRDRGAPGTAPVAVGAPPPPRNHHDRAPPPPPTYRDRDRDRDDPAAQRRAPAWRADGPRANGANGTRHDGPLPPARHALPPRPPDTLPNAAALPRDPSSVRGGGPGGGGGSSVDTYIPSYSSGGGPPRRDRDRGGDDDNDGRRRGSRDHGGGGGASRDGGGGGGYRDLDRPPNGDRGAGPRERDASYRRSTRSRSPERDTHRDGQREWERGGGGGDDRRLDRDGRMGRDRDRDRDQDGYSHQHRHQDPHRR